MKKSIVAVCLVLTVLSFAAASGQKDAGASMMAADTTVEKGFFDLSGLGPSVLPFTGEDAAKTLAAANTTVYFFAATWCPTCRSTYQDIVANYARFPRNFRLIVVNYDTSRDLKAKYGVTYQHTFVSIDTSGKAVAQWSGSPGVADIVTKAGNR